MHGTSAIEGGDEEILGCSKGDISYASYLYERAVSRTPIWILTKDIVYLEYRSAPSTFTPTSPSLDRKVPSF